MNDQDIDALVAQASELITQGYARSGSCGSLLHRFVLFAEAVEGAIEALRAEVKRLTEENERLRLMDAANRWYKKARERAEADRDALLRAARLIDERYPLTPAHRGDCDCSGCLVRAVLAALPEHLKEQP